MIPLLLLLLALAPVAALAVYVYKKDTYEKEPLRFLVRAFIGGAVVTLYALAAEMAVHPFIASVPFKAVRFLLFAFISAGLIEEGAKYFRFRTLVYGDRNFNEPFDAIVYAVMISLGFAALENVGVAASLFFTKGAGVSFAVVIMRALISVPAHACFAMIMGHYFALARFGDADSRSVNIAKALWVPALLHGAFDFFLFVKMGAGLLFLAVLLRVAWLAAFSVMKQASDGSPFNPHVDQGKDR